MTLLQRALNVQGTKRGAHGPIYDADIGELADLIDAYCGGRVSATALARAIDPKSAEKKSNPTTRAQTILANAMIRLYSEGWKLARPE